MIAEHVQRNIYILKDVSHLQKWFTAKGDILVLDDLMAEGGYDREIMDLFTKHSHHRNITVLYLFQDMFPPCKYAKTISRNSHYIVAFKNPRDQLSMHDIISQAYPKTWEQVMEVYRKETERLFGYLTVDFHPASHDRFRIVSRLLKHEGCMRYFILPSHNLTSIKVTPYEKKRGGRRVAQRGGFALAVTAVPAMKALVTSAVIKKLGKKAAVALGHYVLKKGVKKLQSKKPKKGRSE